MHLTGGNREVQSVERSGPPKILNEVRNLDGSQDPTTLPRWANPPRQPATDVFVGTSASLLESRVGQKPSGRDGIRFDP
jgi:hypothetical protein